MSDWHNDTWEDGSVHLYADRGKGEGKGPVSKYFWGMLVETYAWAMLGY